MGFIVVIMASDRGGSSIRGVVDGRGVRAGEDGRLGRSAIEGDPREARRLRICEALRHQHQTGEGAAVDLYNAGEWLLDRNIADGHGQAVAIRCQGRSTTYADVLADVWRVQAVLSDLAVSSGQRVLLVLNDDPAFVSWFIGGMRAGVVPVPLSTMLTAPELALIAADAEPDVIVVSADYVDRVDAMKAAAPSLRHVVVVGDVDHQFTLASTSWSDVPAASEAGVAPTGGADPAFWLY